MTEFFSSEFFIRLVINLVAIYVLVRGCYFNHSRHRDYASSFILFGIGVFLITGQLHSVEISMGFAFGLFAIFSMLRYRTESISIKEMTYLFLVIAVALLCAVAEMPHLELIGLLVLLCAVTWLTETSLLLPLQEERDIEYEKIENIVPERHQELLADLRARTGLDIRNVEIVSINFLRDTARLKIQFVPPRNGQ